MSWNDGKNSQTATYAKMKFWSGTGIGNDKVLGATMGLNS